VPEPLDNRRADLTIEAGMLQRRTGDQAARSALQQIGMAVPQDSGAAAELQVEADQMPLYRLGSG